MKMMNHPRLLFNVFTAETVSGWVGWGLWEATVIAFHLSFIKALDQKIMQFDSYYHH